MMKSNRVSDYLRHILQAIDRIQRYTAQFDDQSFIQNELVQDAVIRNIEIIGEAANNIQKADPVFASTHREVPWLVMYTMRNRITHGYDKVDLEIVWRTIQSDLPKLQIQIRQITDSLSQ